MNNKWIFQALIALTILLGACTKEGIVYDEDIPSIKILSPAGQTIYATGDTVDIHVQISDNDELHEIDAVLSGKSQGVEEVVWEVATHSHDAIYDLYYRLVVPLSVSDMEYKLEVSASDHHNNIGKKTLVFRAM